MGLFLGKEFSWRGYWAGWEGIVLLIFYFPAKAQFPAVLERLCAVQDSIA
jgi:hypothetical protein